MWNVEGYTVLMYVIYISFLGIIEVYCLDLSIITDILAWKPYHRSFFIENLSINVEFLNNRTGEITAVAYLVFITEIVSDCQQIGTGFLLIINDYILGLL